MTPNRNTQSFDTNPRPAIESIASPIVILAGIWTFLSPWIYSITAQQNAWNSWIIGALLVILGFVRLMGPSIMAWISWVHCALGIWLFASPWIFGYTLDRYRFTNNVIVGALVSASRSPARLRRPVSTIRTSRCMPDNRP